MTKGESGPMRRLTVTSKGTPGTAMISFSLLSRFKAMTSFLWILARIILAWFWSPYLQAKKKAVLISRDLPVIRTAFRFPTVNGEFFRIVSQSGVHPVNLLIGSPGCQLLKQICTIYTGVVIGNRVQSQKQVIKIRAWGAPPYVLSQKF